MARLQFFKFSRVFLVVCLGYAAGISGVASAVSVTKPNQSGFIKDPTKLRASMSLPVSDKIVPVTVPTNKLMLRTKNSEKDPRIEAVTLSIPNNEESLEDFAEKLAQTGKVSALLTYFRSRIEALPGKDKELKRVRISLTPEAATLINYETLASDYTKTHHQVMVHARELQLSPERTNTLLDQTSLFLSEQEQQNIKSKIAHGENLNLETDILPDFARRMSRKFLVYRGPNCFHAALAFHGTTFSDSPFVNVKREQGYHAAMINYDELWRAIDGNFYEVDVEKSPLKFGDMLVFFEAGNEKDPINFKWIRHTATYLFGPYTFSKGSKSPDTPYTTKTVDEEWATWSKYVKNLGLKVFRRSQKSVKKLPPKELTDWLY